MRETDATAKDAQVGIMGPAGASFAKMGPKKYVILRKKTMYAVTIVPRIGFIRSLIVKTP